VRPPRYGGGNFVTLNIEKDISFGNKFDFVERVTGL